MYRLVLGICLLLGWLAAPALAEPRLALVIGIADYRSLGVDDRAEAGVADAKLMAGVLEQLGFSVQLAVDVDQKKMNTALRDFATALAAAGPDATGVFYFSGSGAAISGEQFLIPREASIQDARDLDLEAMSLGTVTRLLEFSGCQTKIVILETDRFNPFDRSDPPAITLSKSGPLGVGFFLAYATSEGELRPEPQTANHPFTSALARVMLESNIDIITMLQLARREVVAATNNTQVPTDTSTLLTTYFFRTD